ncbi:hypothetical protein JCM13210_18820 [Thermaerobacter litoralis]
MGPVAGFAAIALEHRTGHRQVHVDADEVHQLERPHGEAGGSHQGVDGLDPRRPLAQQPEGLAVERPGHPVDHEARGVGAHHGLLAQPAGQVDPAGHGLGRAEGTGDHFHQPHGRHRVEKVQADEPLRPGDHPGQGRDGQGRGVAGDQGLGADPPAHARQQVLLEPQVFGRRLDHHGRRSHSAQVRGGLQPPEPFRRRAGRNAALLLVPPPGLRKPPAGPFQGGDGHIVEDHGKPRLHGHPGDAAAHGAGTQHRHHGPGVHQGPTRRPRGGRTGGGPTGSRGGGSGSRGPTGPRRGGSGLLAGGRFARNR